MTLSSFFHFVSRDILMAKLKLELDALQVETFGTTAAASGEGGTVHGLQITGTKPSCVSCGGYTDPCLCDPIQPLTKGC